ncbi:MAG TPA: tetratricopeptide repeat protein [Bryobacteraceae bacterium]|nr:tetratricopeptide repeat protein [Bryobacteraceae bacterium]
MLALIVFLAFQTLSPEAIKHAEAGMEAQKQGKQAEAITEFRRVAELMPELAAAHVNLGQAYMQAGDFVNAIAPLKRALELNPDLIGAHQGLGYSLLAAGYAADAIPHLEKIQAVDALGVAQLKAGRYAEAIGNLRAALQQRPTDPDLLYYLGRAAGLLSQQTFETLQKTQSDSARAHQILGETYAVLHNTAGAEKEFIEAIRLRPTTPGIRSELGDLYVASSRWDLAEAQFRAESHLQPGDGEAAFRLGNALLQQGKVKDARTELERANQLGPGLPETLYLVGKTASLDGDGAAAEKAWMELLSIDQTSQLAGQAHFGLANLYRQQGNAGKAAEEMKEFQRLQKAK